jgi:hypothetical protein
MELVVIENFAVEFNPRWSSVPVVLELMPVFYADSMIVFQLVPSYKGRWGNRLCRQPVPKALRLLDETQPFYAFHRAVQDKSTQSVRSHLVVISR